MGLYKQYKGEIKVGNIYRGGNGRQYRKVLKITSDVHYSLCDSRGIPFSTRSRSTDYGYFMSWAIEEVKVK